VVEARRVEAYLARRRVAQSEATGSGRVGYPRLGLQAVVKLPAAAVGV
jgi:hypothetical protein